MIPDFPEYIPLGLELKEAYNDIVSDFPPYSDISFTTLQNWWNLSEQLSISLLNGNLVINYQLPFDEDNSGLSLVGKNKVDDSLNSIFNYLREKQAKLEIVHVPEFTVKEIANRDAFGINEELDYNEYLLDSEALAKLEGPEYQLLRKKIKRFRREVGEKHLEIKSLNLSLVEIQDEIFQSIAKWQEKNRPDNDPENTEHHALKKSMRNAADLNVKNLALYIDNELHGIMIYHQPLGREYYILNHLKVNYETPYISDYVHHQIAKKASSENVSKLNIEMDLGIENLRRHKMTLRPAEFFRKYTITPANLLPHRLSDLD